MSPHLQLAAVNERRSPFIRTTMRAVTHAKSAFATYIYSFDSINGFMRSGRHVDALVHLPGLAGVLDHFQFKPCNTEDVRAAHSIELVYVRILSTALGGPRTQHWQLKGPQTPTAPYMCSSAAWKANINKRVMISWPCLRAMPVGWIEGASRWAPLCDTCAWRCMQANSSWTHLIQCLAFTRFSSSLAHDLLWSDRARHALHGLLVPLHCQAQPTPLSFQHLETNTMQQCPE